MYFTRWWPATGRGRDPATAIEPEKIISDRVSLLSMNVALRKSWTQEQFFAWAAAQEGRHEFDGFQPVAMTGGTVGHAVVMRNLHRALDARLRNGECQPLGPDAGVETVGTAVRYPDALVTCSSLDLASRTVPGAVVVFEVLSANTSRTDRIVKVREYATVPSIRRYVILESTNIGLTVMERDGPDEVWRVTTLTNDDILRMPEIGIEMPVSELYAGVSFPEEEGAS
jgi:Uma2 family endonuclease